MLADEAVVAQNDALFAPGPLTQVGGTPDDAPAQPHPVADIGVVVHDRPLNEGVATHDDVRAQHRVLSELSAGLHPAVVADDGRPVDLGLGVDLGPLPQPDPFAQAEAGHVHTYLAVEDVLVGAHIGLESADVLPVALGDVPEQGPSVVEERGEDVGREVHDLTGRNGIEDVGLEDVDARVYGVAEHLPPRRLLEEALDGAVLPGDDDPELQRVLHGLEADGRHGLVLVVEAHDLAQVEVGEDVPGDHEEALVELGHGVAHGSRGAER